MEKQAFYPTNIGFILIIIILMGSCNRDKAKPKINAESFCQGQKDYLKHQADIEYSGNPFSDDFMDKIEREYPDSVLCDSVIGIYYNYQKQSFSKGEYSILLPFGLKTDCDPYTVRMLNINQLFSIMINYEGELLVEGEPMNLHDFNIEETIKLDLENWENWNKLVRVYLIREDLEAKDTIITTIINKIIDYEMSLYEQSSLDHHCHFQKDLFPKRSFIIAIKNTFNIIPPPPPPDKF